MKTFTLQSFENYHAQVGESFLEEECDLPFSINFYIGYLFGKYPERGVKAMEEWDEWIKISANLSIPFNGISFFDLVDGRDDIFPTTDEYEQFNFDEFYSTFVELANSCEKFNKGFVEIFEQNGVEV